MTTLSYSSMKTYAECPLRYKFAKIDHIKTPGNRYLLVGSLVHEAIETGWDAQKFADISLKHGADIAEEVRSILSFSKGMIRCNGEHEVKLALDKNMKQVDFDDENAVLRGIIDCLEMDDDTATIIDYKTNHAANSDPLQLRFYAFLVYHIFHPNQITVEFRYLRLRRNFTQTFSGLDLEVDTSIWDAALRYAQMIEEDMKHGFKANPGEACASCPFSGMCDAFKEFKEHTFGIIPSTPEEIANAILIEKALDTQKRMLHDQIKKYISVFGELETSNVKAYFSKVKQEKVSLDKLLEYAQKNNVDLHNVEIPAARLAKKIPKEDLEDLVHVNYISKINTKVLKK